MRLRQVTGIPSCYLVAPKQCAGRFTQYLGPVGGVDLTPAGRVNSGLPYHDRRIKVTYVTGPLGSLAGLPRQPDDLSRAGLRRLVHLEPPPRDRQVFLSRPQAAGGPDVPVGKIWPAAGKPAQIEIAALQCLGQDGGASLLGGGNRGS